MIDNDAGSGRSEKRHSHVVISNWTNLETAAQAFNRDPERQLRREDDLDLNSHGIVRPEAVLGNVKVRSSSDVSKSGASTESTKMLPSDGQARQAKNKRGWFFDRCLSACNQPITNHPNHRQRRGLPSTLPACIDRDRAAPGSCLHTLPSQVSIEEHPIGLPSVPPQAHLNSDHDLPQYRPYLGESRLTLQQCCVVPSQRTTRKLRRMGLSKSQRIIILLAIDSAFFLLELVIGYAVHSLALVADAFHMLNDVLSLCVGLWAVKVAQSGTSKMYTYGWQRAETLGALVNGVFLVALCVTIFLEAIQRFVEKPNVTNPQLVLIVGCLGLASNLIGLVLFHDVGHSHAHGEDEHAHAEEGYADVHEEHSHAHASHDHPPHERSPLVAKDQQHSKPSLSFANAIDSVAPTITRKSISTESTRHRRRTSVFGSVDDRPVHPAYLRQDVIQAARNQESAFDEEDDEEDNDDDDHVHHHEQDLANSHGHAHAHGTTHVTKQAHAGHNHTQPKGAKSSSGGHGHNHGDLNMRGVFLHVLGDALGNIGVIATALIIWLTKFPGRFYFDPAISIVITIIILTSAIPLCKAASRILLQAVPMGISIDEIRADVEDLPQVVEAHHVHVWQLSDTKLVASLHVKIDTEIQGVGSAQYMKLAREIRACLHGYGIHSSTIQPEFLQKVDDNNADSPGSSGDTAVAPAAGSKAGSLISADGLTRGDGCMLDCENDCGSKGQCCPSTDGVGQR